MASRADVLLAENERLNAQRLQLLRDLRSHAQTLGSKSVLHYGLSAAQVRDFYSPALLPLLRDDGCLYVRVLCFRTPAFSLT